MPRLLVIEWAGHSMLIGYCSMVCVCVCGFFIDKVMNAVMHTLG